MGTTPPRARGGRDNPYNHPAEQALAFASWLFLGAGQLDVGAARYDHGTGRVARVEHARLPVCSLTDFERLLPWARARNAAGLNIWVRPASLLPEHPYLMLDDLSRERAAAILQKYAGAVVETSPGNTQAWLRCSRPMDREQRQNVLRRLVAIVGSDSGAISEPRWGRLPGFQQRKPGKSGWTNLLNISAKPPFDPAPYLDQEPSVVASLPAARAAGVVPSYLSGEDQSRREFGVACKMIREGVAPALIVAHIQAMVDASGRRKSRDYAKRTVAAAFRAVRS